MDSENSETNPYAAPASSEAPAVGPLGLDATSKYGLYRDNRKLSAWLVGLLAFGIAYGLLRGALNLAYTLTDFGADGELFATIERVMTCLGIAQTACMIVFGTWIVRSAKNAWLFAESSRLRPELGFHVQQTSLPDTPGWAVGYYFIPIANFWKPFTAMRDIVRASTLREGPPALLLPTWWTLWIVSNIGDRFTRMLNSSGTEWHPGAQAVAWASIAGIDVALHLIAIILVRTVTSLQTDTAAALAEAISADSPPS